MENIEMKVKGIFKMHTFQPYPTDLLEMNPFTKFGKEWGLITAGNKTKYNTMTISWGGMGILWNKNVVYVFVRDSRYTKEFMDKGEFFSLSFFAKEYHAALAYCGAHSGRDEDKFEKAGLTPAFRHSIPYPDEANLIMLCRKMATVPLPEEILNDTSIMGEFYKDNDMHTMYIGEIMEVVAR